MAEDTTYSKPGKVQHKPAFAAHTPSTSKFGVWHGLKAYLTKVAKRAGNLAAKFNTWELGYYAGLWHDLGKYIALASLLSASSIAGMLSMQAIWLAVAHKALRIRL